MTFLQQTAQYIFDQHETRMDDVWVILPTRRAVSVFQQQLAACSDRPFLAPHTLAVDDFITQAADVQLIDPVSLLFALFDVFREIDETVEFEQFIGWASILLADFDRIDQYLVKPTELFSYLTAAKALERWNLSLPPGGRPVTETPVTTKYFRLFENLQIAYDALRARLDAQGLAYRGMAYRRLAEEVEVRIRDNSLYEKLYFVGFNALSAAEERIIHVLTKTGPVPKAELLWDADDYYLNDRSQEAGTFLRRYKHAGLPGFREVPALLTTLPRHVRMMGVPTASLQAKVAGQLYADWLREAQSAPDGPVAGRTAIVLADESLLVPVLYSLDESVRDLNVTMGLSLRQSLLFTLVDALFEMQRTVAEIRTKDDRTVRIPKFHHRHVIKVLNHPFIRQYERIRNLTVPTTDGPASLLTWVIEDIVRSQKVYLDEKEMRRLGSDDPLFRVLFTRWPTERPMAAIRALYDLIDLLRAVYRESQDAIEIEYLYLFFSLLKQLENTLERHAGTPNSTPVTLRSFRQFLNELIRQTSIPFTSEGDSRLQVMGMLETRALDFERVIVLSANEGILPQSRHLNSLIPFDISSELKLPTYREQESVTAYHFYRLLQRAREVVLLYTTSPDAYGNSKGEPSRFVRQLEYELIPASNGNTILSKPAVRIGAPAEPMTLPDLEVPKTESIRQKLKEYLTNPKRGLYPTALNQFIGCSMKFYFVRVAGISEETDVEERMGAAEFGDWLHRTLETLDEHYRMKNKPVTEPVVRAVLAEVYADIMKGRVLESGMNLLVYDMAQKLMLDFVEKQNELTGLEVLQTEKEYAVTLPVPIDGETIQVRVAGKIDRIERYQGQIRVIDYKTGKVELPGQTAIGQLAEKLPREGDSKWDKARQLWLYKYLVLKESEYNDQPVTAGFYSFRDPTFTLKANTVQFANGETPDDYIRETEAMLTRLVQDMLDPARPFRKTDRLETCTYCDYRKICGR